MSRRATPAQIDGNVEGTRRVLRAARQAGVGRVLHCSSVSAIGLREDGEPADEEVAWNYPRFGLDDGYCTTKHLAEEAVREELAQHPDLDVVIANPTYMFGPMDARPSSGALIVDLVRGRIPATSPGINNYVDVRDVARGIWAVAERGRRGQRYILGGQEHSYADIMALIARLAGCPAPRLQLPRWVAAIGGYLGDLNESLLGAEPRLNSATVAFAYTRHFRFRCDLAQQELGYRAGPIEPAIEAALAWFRGAGMI
jgi:dihydroflavonol-4-reductase